MLEKHWFVAGRGQIVLRLSHAVFSSMLFDSAFLHPLCRHTRGAFAVLPLFDGVVLLDDIDVLNLEIY